MYHPGKKLFPAQNKSFFHRMYLRGFISRNATAVTGKKFQNGDIVSSRSSSMQLLDQCRI